MTEFGQGAAWGVFAFTQALIAVRCWKQMPNDGPKGWLSRRRFAVRAWLDEHRCMACGRIALRLHFVNGMGGIEQECGRCAGVTGGDRC